MLNFLTVFVFSMLSFKTVYGIVFTGTSSMEKLLITQTKVIEEIEKSLHLLPPGSKEEYFVLRYLKTLKREHNIAGGNPEHYLGNPINAFKLITRLDTDLMIVEQLLYNISMYKRDKSLVYPSEEDVSGAIDGLLRVHIVYNLNVTHLANGTISTNANKYKKQYVEYVSPMTANDCFDLGFSRYPYDAHDPQRNLPWLEEAYRRHENDKYFYPFPIEKLIHQIADIYYSMGDLKNTLYWLEQLLIHTPGNIKISTIVKNLKEIVEPKGTTAEEVKNQPLSEPKNFTNFFTICRGDGIANTKNSFSCYYAHGPHSFLRLAPIKAEVLHKDPDIVMFHEIVSDAEIVRMKTLAKKTLSTEKVLSHNNTPKNMFDVKTGDVTRLPENEDIILSKTIEHFTGLRVNTQTSERLQVTNYGIGGHFAPHYDYYHDYTVLQTAATVLIYMSDVEQGGATAFLEIGLAAFPVKNSALFWMNVDTWGRGVDKTWHAACPVLRGAKWVATKWIFLKGQDTLNTNPSLKNKDFYKTVPFL